MPKITKQTTRPIKRGSSIGVLGGVIPVGDMPETGMKVCLYGRSKTGKTSLACTWSKPLLILGTEDGTKSVRGVKDVDFLRLAHSSQVEEAAVAVAGAYSTVVLDTAGGLQDMILKEILGLEDVPIEKSWGMAGRDQWQTCGAQVKERLRNLLGLADRAGTHVVVIAHERNFNDEGGSDLIFPTVGAALTPSVTGWLNGACDYLCQTFLREETKARTVKAGKTETAVAVRTGRVEYCLRVGPHPIYQTGFRRPHVAGEVMPDVIVDPSYDEVLKRIQ